MDGRGMGQGWPMERKNSPQRLFKQEQLQQHNISRTPKLRKVLHVVQAI